MNASGLMTKDKNVFVVSYNKYICNIHSCVWNKEICVSTLKQLYTFIEKNGFYPNPMFKNDDLNKIVWDIATFEMLIDKNTEFDDV
jgi:predicted lactoylglutathione lyase